MSPRRRKAGNSASKTPTEAGAGRQYVIPTDPTICYGEPASLDLLGLPGCQCGCPLHLPSVWIEIPSRDGTVQHARKQNLRRDLPPPPGRTDARE